MIGVVIPYFQRDAGVLRRALNSVAQQTGVDEPVEVIVVDDASPAPAEPELAAIAWPPGISCRLLTQANAGPGAARNSGIGAVLPAARCVAFLDSDDEWSPDHLARALAALGQGHDLYFADHYQLGQQVGAFARAGRIRPAEHPVLPGPAGLHRYDGDLFDQILSGNVIGTSTVVYRPAAAPDVRFRTEYRAAGEDYLFWMDLAVRGVRTAFSSQVEATYGRGVNVFAGALWGTPGHLRRVQDDIRYRRAILDLFRVTPTQSARLRASIAALRDEFAGGLLSQLAQRRGVPMALLAAQWRVDPAAFARVPRVIARKLMRTAS